MNDDAAAAKHRCWVGAVGRVELIVVDEASARVIPNPDSEFILTASARLVAINRRQHEAVITGAVDCARAFVLRALRQ